MVKILSTFLATLAAISPVVQAGNCVPKLQYCGSTLQRYNFPGAGKLRPDVLYNCASPQEAAKIEAVAGPMVVIEKFYGLS
ncbi:hypothetical protein E4U32_007459 [Claviceps aff. humidiphila group G2b]|nr:hypothetical protein E4U32_007459 [Claviceps aff. humidiphila group G2b]